MSTSTQAGKERVSDLTVNSISPQVDISKHIVAASCDTARAQDMKPCPQELGNHMLVHPNGETCGPRDRNDLMSRASRVSSPLTSFELNLQDLLVCLRMPKSLNIARLLNL